jgi:DNA polymerase III subunit delta'
MLFSQIPGIRDVKETLVRSVRNDHVAHAQMFLGQQGGPGMALALAFASMLTCDKPTETDACGQCASCHKNAKFIHPDVHFIFPVVALGKASGKEAVSQAFLPEWRKFLAENPFGNEEDWLYFFGGDHKQLNISKEEARNIIKSLSYSSLEGKYKIMIIWLPEYMHPNAANALLKILEEPPKNTLFLLVANDEEKLLSTITSRTQIFRIPPVADEEIVKMLTFQKNVDTYKGQQIAYVARGSIREALRLIDEVEENQLEWIKEWMRACFIAKPGVLLKFMDEFSQSGKTGRKSLLEYTLDMLRESLLVLCGRQTLTRLTQSELEFVVNFSKALDFDSIESIAKILEDAIYHLERNANDKITFLDVSFLISRCFVRTR